MAIRKRRVQDAEMQESGNTLSRAARKADMYRKLVATPSVLAAAGLFTISGIAGGFLTFGQMERPSAPARLEVASATPASILPAPQDQAPEIISAPAPVAADEPLALPPVLEAALETDTDVPVEQEEIVFTSGSLDAATGREERRATTRPQLTEEQAEICRENLQAAADRLSVRFPNGSVNAAPEDMDAAFSFAEGVAVCDGLRILVGGHADSRGDETQNLILSWERAESVINAIAAAGHDISIYEPVGYGSRQLLIQEAADAEGEALNRRVEFAVVEQRQ